MRVLITGANGFIGKNLMQRLKEEQINFSSFAKGESLNSLKKKLKSCEFVVHLAGVNRPEDVTEFKTGNSDLTQSLCELLQQEGLQIPIVYSSSIQADIDNPYGISKRVAEDALLDLSKINGNKVFNYRLPNVFGKWSRPNYNSAVATFCHNIINDLPIKINDPDSLIKLVYIDDVVNEFVSIINSSEKCVSQSKLKPEVKPVYSITVGELEAQLIMFKNSKKSLTVENVGTGLTRALYSTYLSYFKPNQFTYTLTKHEDPRGVFVEMLKTKNSGQVSFFSAHPGITRGGHYHHSKNEKFLVIKGEARFGFRHILTDEYSEILASGDEPQIVETVPGWSHDVTNVGDDEMFVMLWANEIFDPENPDTIYHKV